MHSDVVFCSVVLFVLVVLFMFLKAIKVNLTSFKIIAKTSNFVFNAFSREREIDHAGNMCAKPTIIVSLNHILCVLTHTLF